MSKPVASRVMDAGPWSQRRETSRKRVLSARAANSAAESSSAGADFGLRRLGKVFFNQRDYDTPTLFVGLEGFCPALQRDLIEAGFAYREHDSVCHLFKREYDQGCGLVGVI